MTLTLIFDIQFEVGVKLKGFSFRRVRGSHNFIRSDAGYYALDCGYHINKKFAQPEFDYVVSELRNVYQSIPFDKIKIEGRYYKTSDEIFNAILNN